MSSEMETLNFAVENNLNVMLIGKHGVGKTAMIKEVFEKHGLNWQYFSASTIDPWVDLIGVPKESIDEDGNPFLDIVRPKALAMDEVEAIFLDEYNRAPKKVRNAAMELIQFGSINGKKLGKLRMVWVAINPDDDEENKYDVDVLDEAQKDRFQIQLPIEYKPNKLFFKNKYGGIGVCAVKWWNDQKKEAQDCVSPRRLDYACEVYLAKGDVRYVFPPKKVNVKSFLEFLAQGDPIEVLEDLCTRSPEEIRAFFSEHNALNHVNDELFKSDKFVEALARYCPDEELMPRLQPKSRANRLIKHVSSNPELYPNIRKSVLSNEAGYNPRVVDAFKKANMSNVTPTVSSKNSVRIGGKRVDVSKMHLCFTGTLQNMTRDQAASFIQGYGAQVSASISLGVNYAVVGADPGSKAKRAKDRGLEIITEDQWNSIVNQLTGIEEGGIANMVTINGKNVDINELTLDNFEEMTGMRYRMTKEQTERLYDTNNMSRSEAREEAFKEFIDSLTSADV